MCLRAVLTRTRLYESSSRWAEGGLGPPGAAPPAAASSPENKPEKQNGCRRETKAGSKPTRGPHVGGHSRVEGSGCAFCPPHTVLGPLLSPGPRGVHGHVDPRPPRTSAARGREQISEQEHFGHVPSWPWLLQFLNAHLKKQNKTKQPKAVSPFFFFFFSCFFSLFNYLKAMPAVCIQGSDSSAAGGSAPSSKPHFGLQGWAKLLWTRGRASRRGGEGWVLPANVFWVRGVAQKLREGGGWSQSLPPSTYWFSNQTKKAFMSIAEKKKKGRKFLV